MSELHYGVIPGNAANWQDQESYCPGVEGWLPSICKVLVHKNKDLCLHPYNTEKLLVRPVQPSTNEEETGKTLGFVSQAI